MLKITIPASEDYDPIHNLFITNREQQLTLEHSLLSISKWESKFHKPFLSRTPMSYDETLAYIKEMTITVNVSDDVYTRLSSSDIQKIVEYIDDPMTATTFSGNEKHSGREIITSELIYYWMIACGIPFECQKWHLNRLLTLIRVCGIKNAPAKKMSKKEIMARNRSLNASRRKALNTSG